MRHNVKGRKFSRTAAHRKMMFRNMVTSLFEHERITTTVTKAKEARGVAERLITFAKKGDLHSRRMAARKVMEPAILQKLFDDIGPRYADRQGGYTRILRIGPRKGDNAELAILELVDSEAKRKRLDSKKRTRARRILKAEEKAEAQAALTDVAEETAAAAATDEAVEEQAEETTETEAAPEETTEVKEEATDDSAADEDEEKKED